MLNQDYRDILSALVDSGADFLLVGAYALASHGLVRATSDIDLWIRPTKENASAVLHALETFGAPMDQVSVEALTSEDQVLQIGVAPVRIDILTSISGVTFSDAWARRDTVELEGLRIPVLSLADLQTNKRATGRPQDLVDLQWIERQDG